MPPDTSLHSTGGPLSFGRSPKGARPVHGASQPTRPPSAGVGGVRWEGEVSDGELLERVGGWDKMAQGDNGRVYGHMRVGATSAAVLERGWPEHTATGGGAQGRPSTSGGVRRGRRSGRGGLPGV